MYIYYLYLLWQTCALLNRPSLCLVRHSNSHLCVQAAASTWQRPIPRQRPWPNRISQLGVVDAPNKLKVYRVYLLKHVKTEFSRCSEWPLASQRMDRQLIATCCGAQRARVATPEFSISSRFFPHSNLGMFFLLFFWIFWFFPKFWFWVRVRMSVIQNNFGELTFVTKFQYVSWMVCLGGFFCCC